MRRFFEEVLRSRNGASDLVRQASVRRQPIRPPLESLLAIVALATASIALTIRTPALPPSTPSLSGPQSVAAPQSAIDTWSVGAGPRRLVSEEPITLLPGAPLSLVGWAVDPTTQSAPRAIYGAFPAAAPVAAQVGLARPDVAAALGAPLAGHSGFVLTMRAPRAAGPWVLRLWLVDSRGKRHELAQRPVVDVRPAPSQRS